MGAVRTGLGWRPIAVGFVALLAITACGDDDGAVASTSGSSGEAAPVTADDLDGRTFVSTSVEGQELVDGTEVTITFEDGSISVQAGCNTMRAGYEVTDNALTVDQVAQTMMACEDDKQAQDEWLAAMLEGGPEVALDGETLTLTSSDVTVTAVDEG